MTGKLGRALVGEWHGAWYGICILPGFVRLDLSIGGLVFKNQPFLVDNIKENNCLNC